jgi:membrane-anchored protein YejM (alkaline phosphatase superfamily)
VIGLSSSKSKRLLSSCIGVLVGLLRGVKSEWFWLHVNTESQKQKGVRFLSSCLFSVRYRVLMFNFNNVTFKQPITNRRLPTNCQQWLNNYYFGQLINNVQLAAPP